MPGYLDQYGAGEERRNSIIKRVALVLSISIVVLGLGWFLLRNHHQEGVVKTFLQAVRSGDFQAAYRDWGCTSPKACTGYDYQHFLGDWAPAGRSAFSNDLGQPDASVLGLTESESCNNGVLLTVAVNPKRSDKLWVDRSSDEINFAPYPICPHKTPFEIMIQRTLGQLRKPLLK
jgi:hypothetical protein